MPKYKVRFNFNDSLIIEAKDEDEAKEKFCFEYENAIASNNETMENRVWESVEIEDVR